MPIVRYRDRRAFFELLSDPDVTLRVAWSDPVTGAFPVLENVRLIGADRLFWRALANTVVLPVLGHATWHLYRRAFPAGGVHCRPPLLVLPA